LVFSIQFLDNKLNIDDPVGAITVHGICGALGTIMVGLFAEGDGLFYGGGVSLLINQVIGVVAVMAWAFGMGFILFKVLKMTIGVRVTREQEFAGLDISEHGEKAYN